MNSIQIVIILFKCLAGFGRTGVALLLIICVNYYRVNK